MLRSRLLVLVSSTLISTITTPAKTARSVVSLQNNWIISYRRWSQLVCINQTCSTVFEVETNFILRSPPTLYIISMFSLFFYNSNIFFLTWFCFQDNRSRRLNTIRSRSWKTEISCTHLVRWRHHSLFSSANWQLCHGYTYVGLVLLGIHLLFCRPSLRFLSTKNICFTFFICSDIVNNNL